MGPLLPEGPSQVEKLRVAASCFTFCHWGLVPDNGLQSLDYIPHGEKALHWKA